MNLQEPAWAANGMVDVSVIVAAWNAAQTITRAVTSALMQSGVSVEVIVADDASTDDTGSVVSAIGDPRIRYLRMPVNGGPAAARNAAIVMAQGAWIAVLDADDMFLNDRLTHLLANASRHRLDVVTDNMIIETNNSARRIFIEEELDEGLSSLSLVDYINCNRLFGRNPAEGYLKPVFAADFLRRHGLRYDAATRIGEDFLLVAEAMALGARYGRVRTAGYVYTTHAASISHRLTRRDADAMVAADRRFLARHATRLDTFEYAALMGHLKALEDGAGFAAMVESIKAHDLLSLARSAWRRPTAVRHFSMPIRARIERLARRSEISGSRT